jgi:DNA polymerase III subunit beta
MLMKLKCQRSGLLDACSVVQMAVAARSTKPILTNIKAVADKDRLTLMATDLEVGVRYELSGVDVSRTGAVILPAGKLVSILRESNDDELTITADSDGTLIKTQSGRFTMAAADPADFPDLPAFDSDEPHHLVNTGVIRRMIRRTVFAADRKESGARWAVTGILWETESGKVRLVATDTKRLALCEGPATLVNTPPDEKPLSHLIPQKAISLLERCLADDGENVGVLLRTNDAMFLTERATIHTRLVEGRFPPFRDIIPKKLPIKVPITVADFHSRVRQAAIMTDDESKRLDLHFATGKLTLNADGSETGTSEVVMDLPDYSSDDVDIAFDPSYLTEMLRAIDGEPNLMLEMINGDKPAVFRLGDVYTYLVMPLTGSS